MADAMTDGQWQELERAVKNRDLRGADFGHADLTGANFGEADFTEASLVPADFRGADWEKALLWN